ncbi:MAG: glycoside hydrolase family 28 protein [bacterium]|nr:glycoside hydrolase family 28 protein [bacterium]
MMKVCVIAAAGLLASGIGLAEDAVYDPMDYGAKPDGVTLCTEAIQNAIDTCAAAGGGSVRLAAGRFLSGTLFLKSNVSLIIDEGATLLGSTELDHYPVTIPEYRSYTDRYTNKSLLYGENLSDIAIVGKGTIDGQGAAFEGEWKVRPYLIRMVTCKNVRVQDITLINSPMWMQHYLACDDVRLQGVTVYNHCNRNNDMIDIDGCKDVLIADCVGDTDDDGITLKSTSARACENVTIRDCTVSSHCNAIKCGTESNGGFKNITIANCTVKPSADTEPIFGLPAGLGGIALEIVDGGTMDNVTVSDITIEGTLAPIFVRLGNRARPFIEGGPKPDVGVLRNVTLRNITATGASAMGCPIAGISGHPIEDLALENVKLSFAGGGEEKDTVRAFGEKAEKYPECKMFADWLPAFGLFCWHVRGLTLTNVALTTEAPDARPAVAFEDVEDITVDSKRVAGNEDAPEGVVFLDKTDG